MGSAGRSVWGALARIAEKTAVQLAAAGLLALASGGTLYYLWSDIARWLRGRSLVANGSILAPYLVIVGLVVVLIVYVLKYRARCAIDAWLPRPWVIRDTGIGLEWRLRRRPESWTREDLDTQPAVVDSMILGPFHSRPLDETGEPCLEPLTVRTAEGAFVATECPRCSRMVYDDWKGVWGLAWLKTRTLQSLRRDVENGKRVRSGYSGDFVGPFIGS